VTVGLDTVELVMEWEAAFAIDIPNEAAERIQTVGDATDWITRHLADVGRPWPRERVLELVCAITCERAGVRRERLTEATSFVGDLGMD
jgi:acyl carrier protein